MHEAARLQAYSGLAGTGGRWLPCPRAASELVTMSDTAPASCPASAATPDLSSTVSPHYAADTSVSQTGSGVALTGLLGLSMLCAAPGMWLAVQFDAEATGWRAAYAALGMFSGMALTMVGMVVGLVILLDRKSVV